MIVSESVDISLREICLELSKRYKIHFLEIGADKDHIHFLIQSVPKISPTQLITTIKRITAREIFKRHAEVKEQLWVGELWTDGYFVNTVNNTKSNYILVRSASPFSPILHKKIVP